VLVPRKKKGRKNEAINLGRDKVGDGIEMSIKREEKKTL